MKFTYKLFCLLRIAVTLFPQKGYIHPDEFFQGPELVYGDLLQIKTYRTWEFTSSRPVRSIVFPFFITGFPCIFADLTGLLSSVHGTYLYSYLLLVLPRLLICGLLFINDFLIYKICDSQKKSSSDFLIIYSSSYVTLTYLTRSLSNCLETLFFGLMLSIVYKLVRNSSKNVSVIPNTITNYYTYFTLGLIFSCGIYNRPTFLAYSIFPLCALLFRENKINFDGLGRKIFCFVLGSLSLSICLCVLDSFYYNNYHYSKLKVDGYELMNNLTFTPLNFILYNSNAKNLSAHGLHPLYFHLIVNIPLLFSVYGFHFIFLIFQYFKNLFRSPLNALNIHKYFFFFSAIFPLCLLSLIPHQEPRFVIPLFLPLLVFSKNILKNNTYKRIWFISNLFGFIFYGFLHQGGIYSSLSYLHCVLNNTNHSAVVFYKTYMPPRFLLGLSKNNVSVHDLAGVDEKEFLASLLSIELQNFDDIFIVVPFQVSKMLHNSSTALKNYKMYESNYRFPHLSTELLPALNDFNFIIDNDKSFFQKLFEVANVFSLHVLAYKIR